MPTVYTEVEVDVDLCDFATDDLLEELEERGKIPAGTQHGTFFRVPNKGMPVRNQSRNGDMFIHIAIQIPTGLKEEQVNSLKEIIEKIKT